MKRLTDDEWLAAARARHTQEGTWDASPPAGSDRPWEPHARQEPDCPGCRGGVLQPLTGVGAEAKCCRTCYGVLLPVGALTGLPDGVETDDPVLLAAEAPRACRDCLKPLRPDGTCPRGHERPAPPDCPGCGAVMERRISRELSLPVPGRPPPTGEDVPDYRPALEVDRCQACGLLWLDVGELRRLGRYIPRESLATRYLRAAVSPQPAGDTDVTAADAIAAGLGVLFRVF